MKSVFLWSQQKLSIILGIPKKNMKNVRNYETHFLFEVKISLTNKKS